MLFTLGLVILGLGLCGYVLTTEKATLVQKALVIAGIGICFIFASSAFAKYENKTEGEFTKFMNEIKAEMDELN